MGQRSTTGGSGVRKGISTLAIVCILNCGPVLAEGSGQNGLSDVQAVVTDVEQGRLTIPDARERLSLYSRESVWRELVALIRSRQQIEIAYDLFARLDGARYSDGLDLLVDGLAEENAGVRAVSALGLAGIGNSQRRRATIALERSLRIERDHSVRLAALRALATIGDPLAAPGHGVIVDIFREANDLSEQGAAAEAMIQVIGIRRSVEVFERSNAGGRSIGAVALTFGARKSDATLSVDDAQALRRFVLGSISDESIDVRRAAYGLVPLVLRSSGQPAAVTDAKVFNRQLRGSLERQALAETADDLRGAAQKYAALIDDDGNVSRSGELGRM